MTKSAANHISWQKRLQYQFDNFMSKGGFAVFLALLSLFLITFVLMTASRYLVEWWFPNQGEQNYTNFTWDVFVQLIGLRDTGEDANFATKFVGVVTIFSGLILFSSLVAFITQEFESKLQSLRKGKSLVVEENHTLILGISDRIIDIINELIIANESEKDAVIVILSDQDKEEIDEYLRNNLGDLKSTRIVTRNGSITNLSDLDMVAIKLAKTVIILNNAKSADLDETKALADARAVKAVLAVTAANEEKKLPPIVVELHSEQYRRLAKNIAPGKVTTLNESDILARILVQTSRSLGLAGVYLNLVGFEGNEFYFYRPEDGWQNITFRKLPLCFSHGTPLGIRHVDGSLVINPPLDYKLAGGDEAIILAQDDSKISFAPQSMVDLKNNNYVNRGKTLEQKLEKYLIIGWNTKTKIILQEYAKYLIADSQVNLVVEQLTDDINTTFNQISETYPHLKMSVLQVDLNSIEEITALNPHDFDTISILSSQGDSSEQVDAKTLTILLEIRQILNTYTAKTGQKVTTELIAEIMNSDDTDLVIKAGVKDFLLTDKFVSKILAQVSQEPDIMSIYNDLFSAEGSELYIKPLWLYFAPEEIYNATFVDCIIAAQQRQELCIGVKINSQAQNKDHNFGIYLVPNWDEQLNLKFEDSLITLAENET